MDLLAGYNDDGDNSQTPEKRSSGDLYGSTKEGEIVGVPPPANLDSEWENFEKLIADSASGGGDSAPTDIHIESTGYKISDDEGPDRAVPKAYAITRSRSRSKSRSRSHSSRSTGSSRSSSADSQKGKKGKRSSSSSDEVPDKEKSSVPQKTDAQEKASSRSPPIIRKERSATPVETRKSKSRSKSKSVERRKGSRHRSRSRSRSRGRHGHGRSSRRHRRSRSHGHEGSGRSSRSKHHRRSRSRDHHRHSRRKNSHDRSRDRHDKRGHNRRRRRSRSHGRDGRQRSPKRDHGRHREEKASGFRGHEPSKPTFKEKMRQQLMKASKMLTDQAQAGQLPPDGERPLVSPKEKPSDLPLNILSAYPNMVNAGAVTPQMALLQTMAVMHQKAQEMTGIAVPKYYNPAAVNPLKYAEQVQKRKLLWSKSKEKKEDTQAVWQGTNFNADNDGKVTAKFRKLMGMKEGETEQQEADTHSEDINRKQQELFHKLDQQYEFARMTTHTHRGIGLGFQSQGMPDT